MTPGDEEIVYRLETADKIGVIIGITQDPEGHYRVGHGRKYGADAPLALHPLNGPALSKPYGPFPRG